MVADPQGLILDSKEYYAPIITPYEAYLAFTDRFWSGSYRFDFDFLHEDQKTASGKDDESCTTEEQAVGCSGAVSVVAPISTLQAAKAHAEASDKQLVSKNASEFMVLKRTYHGLEAPVTGAERKAAQAAVQGRLGRAAGYADEPAKGDCEGSES